MRIVVDMQGAQTESRFRGIGRYSLSFVQALVRNRGEHDVILALSGLFPDTIEPIRLAFEGLLPQQNIRVWYALGPVHEREPGNEWRRHVAEYIREAFLASLKPDVVHLTSLFEGFVDDAVTSIGLLFPDIPTSVTLYDLIPLRDADRFLKPNPAYEEWYRRKLAFLGKADLALAISEATRQDAQQEPTLAHLTSVNVSTSCSDVFRPLEICESDRRSLLPRLGIDRDFILCAATVEPHKNVPRLLRAFARLPLSLQSKYSIVLVGRVNPRQRSILQDMARDADVDVQQVVVVGYVNDEDLAALYNLCTTSVVASYYEGFGLPALEAMSCGAAVIGSNATSIPEIIGEDAALFDPHDDASIASKLRDVLEDDEFRNQLRAHGLAQARNFSWDRVAERALRAFEDLARRQAVQAQRASSEIVDSCVQAIASLKSAPDDAHNLAVADALARTIPSDGAPKQILVDVSEISQRDARTGCQRVARSILLRLLENPPEGFVVEPVYATAESLGYRYARRFKAHLTGEADPRQDDPIDYGQGDIFFGLDYQAHVVRAQEPFLLALKRHGVIVCALVYDILSVATPHFFPSENELPIRRWLTTVSKLDGVLCISRSVREDLRDWLSRYAPVDHDFWFDWIHLGADIENSAPTFGFPEGASKTLSALKERPTFLMVGTIEPRKGYSQALAAFEDLWEAKVDVNLVVVGQAGWMTDAFIERVRHHPQLNHQLFWLVGISDEYLAEIYAGSACLISASEGEGFGLPLIEAARHKIPILARDIPVFREVAGIHAAYFGGTSGADLANAVRAWLALYKAGKHPKSDNLPWLTWEQSAAAVTSILLKRYHQATAAPRRQLASSGTACIKVQTPQRQLLVDISEISKRDVKTGCQRVTRGVLLELLKRPPEGFRVEPVFANSVEWGYFYARRATAELTGQKDGEIDTAVEYRKGDIFFGLDYNPLIAPAQASYLLGIKRGGVKVRFLVHDILPVSMPKAFAFELEAVFRKWLETIAKFDGVICVSKSTADDLQRWYHTHNSNIGPEFQIDWVHNAADIENSTPSFGLRLNAGAVIDKVANRPSFLTVGTLEPRKGHALLLAAFEALWAQGVDVNFVIVGKQGWEMEGFVAKLRRHRELRERLIWLEGVSDEYLEALYRAAACLIVASEGEGFGLPLIEAARHKLPILARDIPVFREIAGDHAAYFSANNARELARAIKDWLGLYAAGKHVKSDGMPWQTWEQSTEKIKSVLLANNEKLVGGNSITI